MVCGTYALLNDTLDSQLYIFCLPFGFSGGGREGGYVQITRAPARRIFFRCERVERSDCPKVTTYHVFLTLFFFFLISMPSLET